MGSCLMLAAATVAVTHSVQGGQAISALRVVQCAANCIGLCMPDCALMADHPTAKLHVFSQTKADSLLCC